MRIERLPTIDSTTLELQRRAQAGPLPADGLTLWADTQTGGIGRLGRRWFSPLGGLWLTSAIPASRPVSACVSLAVAVLLADLIDQVLVTSHRPERCRIKWPNDLMLADRKLGGILIHTVRQPTAAFLLVGIGVNLQNPSASLPPDVAARACSLADMACPADLDRFGYALLAALPRAVARDDSAESVSAARQRLWRPDRDVPITLPDGTEQHGRMLDLCDDGALLVCFPEGTRPLHSVQEVQW
ncbi:MAG: biotin--[acetyl-CoA-carboxylase] ligase [Planctomycetaceae bacterium]|nr:biotin--[acetyl-CoA-carboxylase] ligase [Phycisphaerales bacterium]MCE2651980.1 biotin--[acetyl-CoA-carboxylase] ligase [Planctomycetaceae bacterium]